VPPRLRIKRPDDRVIGKALEEANGLLKDAAKMLGLTSGYLSRLCHQRGINFRDYRWPDDRMLAVWKVSGLSRKEVARRSGLTLGAVHKRMKWLPETVYPPTPTLTAVESGPLKLMIVAGWVPFMDEPEVKPFLHKWQGVEGRLLWQIVGLLSRRIAAATRRDFARLIVQVDELAWTNHQLPILLAGVSPRRASFYERRLEFTRLRMMGCEPIVIKWDFAGWLPAAVIYRDYEIVKPNSPERAWWRKAAEGVKKMRRTIVGLHPKGDVCVDCKERSPEVGEYCRRCYWRRYMQVVDPKHMREMWRRNKQAWRKKQRLCSV